jgi:hypothetical protein
MLNVDKVLYPSNGCSERWINTIRYSFSLLLTLFVALSFFPPGWWRRYVSPKRRFLEVPQGVTFSKTAFFVVLNAVTTLRFTNITLVRTRDASFASQHRSPGFALLFNATEIVMVYQKGVLWLTNLLISFLGVVKGSGVHGDMLSNIERMLSLYRRLEALYSAVVHVECWLPCRVHEYVRKRLYVYVLFESFCVGLK